MPPSSKTILALVGLLLVIPASAAAQEGLDEGLDQAVSESLDVDQEEVEDQRIWSVAGGTTMYVYQGVFASVANDSPHAGSVDDGSGAFDMALLAATVSPTVQWEDFTFSGRLQYNQFVTAAGGINGPYEGRFQDIGISASHRGVHHEGSGLSLRPTFGVELPTSSRSRTMTMIASTSLGVRLSRNFMERFTLSYGLTGVRTFFRYTSPVLDIEAVGIDNALYRPDGAESVAPGQFAVGGYNTPWGLVHGLNADVAISERLTATVAYSLSTGWSYGLADDDDDFASEYQCSGCGNRSAQGGGMQLASGAVILNYALHERVGFNAGIGNVQPPKKNNNQGYNFPFWNFSGSAANASSITIGVNGRY